VIHVRNAVHGAGDVGLGGHRSDDHVHAKRVERRRVDAFR
jgi:hypothetical protein